MCLLSLCKQCLVIRLIVKYIWLKTHSLCILFIVSLRNIHSCIISINLTQMSISQLWIANINIRKELCYSIHIVNRVNWNMFSLQWFWIDIDNLINVLYLCIHHLGVTTYVIPGLRCQNQFNAWLGHTTFFSINFSFCPFSSGFLFSYFCSKTFVFTLLGRNIPLPNLI